LRAQRTKHTVKTSFAALKSTISLVDKMAGKGPGSFSPFMYSIDWTAILGRVRKRAPGQWLQQISPTVWALGFTSLLTDVSSEMVASVLPMYLVLQLGISPVAFGLIDGLYQGMAALVRILGGVLADRSRKYKQLAAIGYGTSAASRLLIIAAGAAWSTIAGVVAMDRIGKGLRTAPRDALISLRSRSEDLATAFGVHRALDAAGAFIGPVVAFLLLARMHDAFDVLFVASFVIAILGVAVIVIFVAPTTRAELEGVRRERAPAASAWQVMRQPRLLALLSCAFLLGLPTISDSFLFLSLQSNLHSAATAFPLFYVGTSISTALLAVPAALIFTLFASTLTSATSAKYPRWLKWKATPMAEPFGSERLPHPDFSATS
jgi:MFS family permease